MLNDLNMLLRLLPLWLRREVIMLTLNPRHMHMMRCFITVQLQCVKHVGLYLICSVNMKVLDWTSVLVASDQQHTDQ